MGDFAVDGSELKKLVKLAKKEPISFAFNPGKSEEEAYCGMHRNKPPAQLGKEAKDAGEGGKFTFGTAAVDGKTINLTCLREMPGLAKRFKKYLKSQKVMLNVVILDADGNVVDSDIETDLPDDPELEGDAADGGSPPDAGEIPDAPPPPPQLDAAAVLKRLSALRDSIAALPPDAQAKVSGPFRQLVDFAKANELERASVGTDKLEAAIKMLAAAAPAPAAAAEGQMQKLQQAADATRARAQAVADDKARGQLLAAMDKVDGHIRAAEAEAAIALLKRLGDIMKSLPDQAAPALKTDASSAKTEWESRFAAMEPMINAALTQGLIEKVDDLRKLRDWTTGMAMQGQHDKALQALPRIEALLEDVRDDGTTAFEDEIAPEVKPFAMARLRWAGARGTMMSEVRKLAAAIVAEAAEDDLLEVAAANVGMMAENVARLDDRLETKLDEIVNAAAGPARDRLKGEAQALIDAYSKELDTPFFRDVDAQSGFAEVAVASTARAALAEISRVLA